MCVTLASRFATNASTWFANARSALGCTFDFVESSMAVLLNCARLNVAERAIGVAQCALELGLKYALERQQFGAELFVFPRVANKLVMMAAEIAAARQITYFAAQRKDSGKRCDLEAGMAKLLGARVAWAAADNALQIHGGNGFAMEYPISRVLADARRFQDLEVASKGMIPPAGPVDTFPRSLAAVQEAVSTNGEEPLEAEGPKAPEPEPVEEDVPSIPYTAFVKIS